MIVKICRGLLLGVLGCPVACCLDSSVLVLLPALGDIVGKWIVGVRCAEECLDGEEDGADLEGGRPVALENIQADATESVDVWVVDLSEEADFSGSHRVIVWKKELKLEGAVLIRRLAWAVYKHVKVSQVVIVRDRADARDWFCHETLSLLDDSLGESHA